MDKLGLKFSMRHQDEVLAIKLDVMNSIFGTHMVEDKKKEHTHTHTFVNIILIKKKMSGSFMSSACLSLAECVEL